MYCTPCHRELRSLEMGSWRQLSEQETKGRGCAEFARVVGIIKSAQTGTISPPPASSTRPRRLRQCRSQPYFVYRDADIQASPLPWATGFTPCPYGSGKPAPSNQDRDRHAKPPLYHGVAFVFPSVSLRIPILSSFGFELLTGMDPPFPHEAGTFQETECSRAPPTSTGRRGTHGFA